MENIIWDLSIILINRLARGEKICNIKFNRRIVNNERNAIANGLIVWKWKEEVFYEILSLLNFHQYQLQDIVMVLTWWRQKESTRKHKHTVTLTHRHEQIFFYEYLRAHRVTDISAVNGIGKVGSNFHRSCFVRCICSHLEVKRWGSWGPDAMEKAEVVWILFK